MSLRILIVTLLTLSLASCNAFGRVTTCQAPPPQLLVKATPLAQPGERPAVTQAEVLSQYVDDIGSYEALRLRHGALSDWVTTYCLRTDQ